MNNNLLDLNEVEYFSDTLLWEEEHGYDRNLVKMFAVLESGLLFVIENEVPSEVSDKSLTFLNKFLKDYKKLTQ